MNRCLLIILLPVCATLIAQDTGVRRIVPLVILAGQSNAVGFDAKPTELPASEVDREILFWWQCGDPPPDEHDSVGNDWTHLQPQPIGDPIKPRRDRQYGNFAQPEGGFGPELGFARSIYAAEQKPLAVIKIAFSGTGLGRDWNPESQGDDGACYRALIEQVRKATAAAKKRGVEMRPRAFLWVQGESDANAKDAPLYLGRLHRMLKALRAELKVSDLPALLAVNTRFQEGHNHFMADIVQAQQQVAMTDDNTFYVDTSLVTIANAAHFDTAGTLMVGQIFAAELRNVEQNRRSPGR